MPVLLKHNDNEIRPLKNADGLPAFFLIPEGIRKKCGKELEVIPREIGKLWKDSRAHDVIESDHFLLAIIDAYA